MPFIQALEKTSEDLYTFTPIGQTPAPGYFKKHATKPCSICALGEFPCILHINPHIENGRRARCEICEETGDDCDAEFPEIPVRRLLRLNLWQSRSIPGETKADPCQADNKGDGEVNKGAGSLNAGTSDVEKRKAWWRMKKIILEALENSCLDGGL